MFDWLEPITGWCVSHAGAAADWFDHGGFFGDKLAPLMNGLAASKGAASQAIEVKTAITDIATKAGDAGANLKAIVPDAAAVATKVSDTCTTAVKAVTENKIWTDLGNLGVPVGKLGKDLWEIPTNAWNAFANSQQQFWHPLNQTVADNFAEWAIPKQWLPWANGNHQEIAKNALNLLDKGATIPALATVDGFGRLAVKAVQNATKPPEIAAVIENSNAVNGTRNLYRTFTTVPAAAISASMTI